MEERKRERERGSIDRYTEGNGVSERERERSKTKARKERGRKEKGERGQVRVSTPWVKTTGLHPGASQRQRSPMKPSAQNQNTFRGGRNVWVSWQS